MDVDAAERFRRADRVFDAALDLSPDERAAFIARTCSGDAELRAAVDRLLQAHERSAHFLDSPPSPRVARLLEHLLQVDSSELPAPQRLGPFEVIREIGRGGMGAVYLGERDDGHFQQRVALKLVRGGIAADHLVRRFLQERRILARLDHPNIARLIDGGVTTDGTPWFAMELVEGQSITRYAADNGLPLEERLRLFGAVCEAVHFAHGMRVIHCDLKPGNMLVAATGAVKLLDFGIAKLLEADLPSDGATTRTAYGMLTPDYAAPEQLRRGPVTAATDIYALGVILYELLVGERPYRLHAHSAVEIERLVCEADPPRPSDAVRRRRGEWRRLRGDLDTIVMKALHKEPERRYASVAALQEDLQRYAEGRRVLARPDTITYRLRRFVKRKSSAVVAASAVVLATLGAGVIVVQASGGTSLINRGVLKEGEPLIVADFEVSGADSALAFLLTSALRMHLDQSQLVSVVPQDRVRSARLALDRPLRRLDATLSREVARREGVRAVVAGELVARRGGYEVKVRLLAAPTGEELAAFRATAKDAETDLLPAIERVARQLRGRIGESLRDVRAEPMPDPVTTSSLDALRLYTEARRSPAGDILKRVTLFRQAIALDSMFAMAYVGLGGALSGHSAAARDSALRKAYELRDRLSGRERVAAMGWYYMLTAHDSRRAISVYEEHLARDSTNWRAIVNLGILYGATRQFARAESLYRSRERALGGLPEENLVYALLAQGKLAAADTLVRRALARRPDNSDAVRASTFSAVTSLQYDSAAARASHWRSLMWSPGAQLWPMGMLVPIARARGRLAEARRLVEESQSIRASVGVDSRPLRDSMDIVAEDVWLRRRPQRGLARLEAALQAHPLRLPGSVDDQADALAAAALYAAAGQPSRARALVRAAELVTDSHARAALAAPRELALGEIALAEGRFLEALAAFRRSDLAQNSWLKNSWLTGWCAVCILPRLARVADRAGWPDSALLYWERYVNTPSIDREGVDAWFLAMAYRRIAELHAARGDRSKAEEAASSLASLWHRADTELQPNVAAARGQVGNPRR